MNAPAKPLLDYLMHGVASLGLALEPTDAERLLDYLRLIQQWNRAYNLTSVLEDYAMVTKHLLDSLALGPLLDGVVYLDVGTGAGLPGIPLAIIYPNKRFYLIEPKAKKCQFMEMVRIKLSVKNVVICPQRIEDYQPQEKVDGVLSRAFTQIEPLYQLTERFLVDGGVLMAMKGAVSEEELEGLPEHVSVITKPLEVPYLDAERHVVIIKECRSEKNNFS